MPTGVPSSFGFGWQAYTPSWTSNGTQPSLGNGTISGRYIVIGNLCIAHFRLIMGSTTTFGTGAYLISLPTEQAARFPSQFGVGDCFDNTGSTWPCIFRYHQTNPPIVAALATNVGSGFVGQTVPFTWAQSDEWKGSIYYEVA
jgi:hypothetical protein